MSKLMIDSVIAGKLKTMKDPILLCDTAGQVLGRVVPASLYDDVVVPFTEEELNSVGTHFVVVATSMSNERSTLDRI